MNQTMDILLTIFGTAQPLTSTIGFAPQVFENYKKKQFSNLSILLILNMLTWTSSWFIYASIKLDPFLSINNFFLQFQIPLFVYILLLGIILLFNLRHKFYLILISFFFIFIYSLLVFIIKFHIEKTSILALQRYIAILLLANFLFYISIIIENYCYQKTYSLFSTLKD